MAATDRSAVSQLAAIGRQTAAGTPAPAKYIFSGLSWDFGPNIDSEAITPAGYRAPTVSVMKSQHTEGKVSGAFGFNEAPFLYATLGYSAPTTPASAVTTRQQVFNLYGLATTPLSPAIYSLERGNSVRGDYCSDAIIKTIGVSWDRKGGIKMEGAFFAQAYQDDKVRILAITGSPTGGTLTLTVGGQTTSTIPWNATAAQVDAAIEALSGVGSGNVVTSGGPLPASPVRIQFADIDTLVPVPTVTVNAAGLTGGTSPAATVSRMAPVSQIDVTPAGPGMVDIYIADSYANLTSSPQQLMRAFSCGWKVDNIFTPIWTGNSSLSSYADSVESKMKTEFSMEVGADDVGMGLLRYTKKDQTIFVRVAFTGPFIETAGGTTYYQRFVQDQAVKLTKPPSNLTVNNDLLSVKFAGEFVQDATWGQVLKTTFTNTLTGF